MVDSNVIYSGIVFKGEPSKVLKAISKRNLQLIVSEDQLEELYRLFKRKSPQHLYLLEAYIALQRTKIISTKKYSNEIKVALKLSRDKKDAPLLACALFVKPEYFVTGDKDFHTKEIKEKINIMTPNQFLETIKSK